MPPSPTWNSNSPLLEAKRQKLKELRKKRAELQRLAAEQLRNRDVFAELGYTPTPRQQEFHDSTEFAILYGGALGGGKSKALTMEAIRACVRYPGLRVGAYRRTYGELKESLLAELAQVGYASVLGASWNGTEYELKFPNGSLIMFRYAETVKDATRRQGGAYQLLIFDELTLTSPDVVAFLETRLRSGRSEIPVLGVRSGTNPGGPGHGTVKQRYVDATDYGRKTVVDKRGRTVRFVPSKLSDNPHINAEYAQDLTSLDETLRKAFLDGDWDIFSGQAFPEWSHDRHVLDPITLPASWKRYAGVDWGFAAPWAVVWCAVDEDGRVWLYREMKARKVGEEDQAKRILAAEAGEHVSVRWADDAMWATRGEAQPIAKVYGKTGVHLTEAGKGGRIAGWQRLRSYLSDGPACPHHREQGWETCPRLHVFSSCSNFVRDLPALPFATKGDPEDIDTAADDHLADALRYLLINLGGGAGFPLIDDGQTQGVEQELKTPVAGRYAMNPDPDAPVDQVDDPDERGKVVTSPWAL